MDVDVDTTMRTKPPIDRKEKLRKVEEKLLSKRTNERFTDCDGVMLDPNLTSTQTIIHLQKRDCGFNKKKDLLCFIT